MCEVLAKVHPPLLLLTLKGSEPPLHTELIQQVVFESDEQNILKRASDFMHWVKEVLDQQYNLVIGHFRDIWGGMAILEFPHIRSVFEVNGLPSIELPYRFPFIAGETLEKVKRIERHCLQKAVAVITPSNITKRCLLAVGCAGQKVTVIHNGALVPSQLPRLPNLPENYFIYVGALQPWQGFDILLKSLRYIQDLPVSLVVCSSYAEHQTRLYRKFSERLEVSDRVFWLYQLDKFSLNSVMQHALFSVAPLTECSRNIEQGCSPLKILESMACSTPVIASELPVVQEIIEHDVDGMLFRAGRPAELARAIRIAVDYPERTAQIGKRAKMKIQQQFTWYQSQQALQGVYNRISAFSF